MGDHIAMNEETILVIQMGYHDALDHNGSRWGRQDEVFKF